MQYRRKKLRYLQINKRTRPRVRLPRRRAKLPLKKKNNWKISCGRGATHRGMSYTRRCQSGTSVSQLFSFSVLSLQDFETERLIELLRRACNLLTNCTERSTFRALHDGLSLWCQVLPRPFLRLA